MQLLFLSLIFAPAPGQAGSDQAENLAAFEFTSWAPDGRDSLSTASPRVSPDGDGVTREPGGLADRRFQTSGLLGSPVVEVLRSQEREFEYGISLLGRASFFTLDTDFTKDHIETYGDVFRTGLGVSAEFELISKIDRDWWWGGYLSVGEDTFGGGASSTDSLGVTVKPDDLTLLSILIGPKTGFSYKNVFAEAHLGVGWAHYLADKATIDTGTGPKNNQEFLRATDRLAAELGARFGWGTPSFFFDLGVGFRVVGGPERGKNADALVSPEAMVTLALEFGLTFRF